MPDEIDPTTSYSRRSGDLYGIKCDKATTPTEGNRFHAFVVNMVRLEHGQWLPVSVVLQGEFGGMRAEANRHHERGGRCVGARPDRPAMNNLAKLATLRPSCVHPQSWPAHSRSHRTGRRENTVRMCG
jgi:hypothetical protein